MPITSVVTPAFSRAFTTVEALKARVDTGSTPDEILQQGIDSWSLRLEREIGRQLAWERVEETIYGRALGVLILERRPVTALHGLSINGTAVDPERYHLDDPAGGLVRVDNAYGWREQFLADATPGLASNPTNARYVVEYAGGFVLPGWPADPYGARTLPVDIEMAVLEALAFQIAEPRAARGGVTSERLADYAVSYAAGTADAGAPPSFVAAVKAYRGSGF